MPIEWQTCEHCGGAWRPYVGTKLRGHARCEFTARYNEIYRLVAVNPMVRGIHLAERLGVSQTLAHLWLRWLARDQPELFVPRDPA
jgi:hypothetical protein